MAEARHALDHTGGHDDETAAGHDGNTVVGHDGNPAVGHDGNPVVEHERPEDWGWHHEWRRSAPVVGWLMTISMALLVFGNHRGRIEEWWLLGLAAIMAAMLIRGRINRKNAWRA